MGDIRSKKIAPDRLRVQGRFLRENCNEDYGKTVFTQIFQTNPSPVHRCIMCRPTQCNRNIMSVTLKCHKS